MINRFSRHVCDGLLRRILLVVSLWMAGHGLQAQINYDHFVYAGQRELQQEHYLTAINHFNIALQGRPDGFEAYFLRGIAKFSLGDYNGANTDFSHTLSIHPLYARAYLYRGISRDQLRDYPSALRDFDKALKIDPFNADFYLARGDTRLHLHQYQEAIEDYDAAIRLERKIAGAYLNRGIARHLSDDNEGALRDVDKAIRLDYFNAEAWLKRGMIAADMDSTNRALSDIDHSLSLDDRQPFAWFQRALLDLQAEDTVAAFNDYQKVLDLDPNNALTYYNRAILNTRQHHFEEAMADYDAVIRINPYNVYTWYNRGSLLAQEEMYEEAEADLSRAIEIFPDFAGAYINRSSVRQSLGKAEEARTDRDRAMAIIEAANGDDLDPAVLYSRYADSAYFERIIEFEADFVNGNQQDGRVQFQRVSIVPKGNFYLVYQLPGKQVIRQGNESEYYTDKAVALFNGSNTLGIKLAFTTMEDLEQDDLLLATYNHQDSILLRQGDTISALFLRGIVFSMVQNYAEAINAYDEALSRDPEIPYAYFNRGTTRMDMDEYLYREQQYTNTIGISSSNVLVSGNTSDIRKPDHQQTLTDYNRVALRNPELPFLYYNRANLKLNLQEYQRAIDDYSQAIALEPDMGEAYYNRALTLLFVNEPGLACKDLSKAGELGIEEAYNVIKRYCTK